MSKQQEAMRLALEALEGGADSWERVGPAIDALRTALVEDAMQKFTDVNQELEAALAEPVLQTCNCRWDGEMQMQQCTLHEAHVDAIKEWAQRAKFAEKKLAALAEQRLTDMEQKMERSIESLKTALAEPEGGGNLPPPLQEPEEFDHSLGADRFKVVRGAFWWHVLIGDSPTEHGKFRSRAGAEKMAADLLREFRNGAFVQHEAALAEPVQEQPVCDECGKHKRDGWALYCVGCVEPLFTSKTEPVEPVAWMNTEDGFCTLDSPVEGIDVMSQWAPLYAAPPQRKPEPNSDYERGFVDGMSEQARRSVDKAVNAMTKCKPLAEEEIARLVTNDMVKFARAIERAHEIT